MPSIQDTADWPRLIHAYGHATTLPDVLDQVGSDDAKVAERAIHTLSGTIHHQGWVYPATEPSVTVLYGFVREPHTHHRPRILGLLSTIAQAIHDLDEHDEAEYGAPDLLPRLQEVADTEHDAGAAASMLLAVGAIAEEQDHPPLAWLRRQLQDTRREVRAAAALALLWCGANEDVSHAITPEIQAAASALDDQLWVEDGGRTAFLISGFEDRPAPQIRLARDALTAPNAHAVLRAGEVMRTWRAAPAELLPPLAKLLNNPELTQETVWQIKQGGPDITLIADALSSPSSTTPTT